MDIELLREKILDLAQDRLLHQGYRHMSVDELAQAAGISKRTLYDLFPSKRDIATQAIDLIIRQNQSAVEKCLQESLQPVDRLRSLFVFVSQQLSRPERVFFEDLQRALPSVWSRFEETRRSIILNLELLIAEGTEQGAFRTGCHPRIVVLAFLGAIESVGSLEVLARSPFSAQEAIESVWQIFLNGILAEDHL